MGEFKIKDGKIVRSENPSISSQAATIQKRPMPKPVDGKQQTWLDGINDENDRNDIENVYNSSGLEEALSAAKKDVDRETKVSKRLANNAYWSSLASTIGALGKFAIVGSSQDGRNAENGDSAEGMRQAASDAAKRRDAAVEKLRTATDADSKYKATLLNNYNTMREKRRMEKYKWDRKQQEKAQTQKDTLEAIAARGDSNIRVNDARHGNTMEEIDARNQGASALEGQRQAGRVALQEGRQEHTTSERVAKQENQNEQNELNRQAAQKRAETAAQGGGTTHSGSRTGGSTTSKPERPKPADDNNDVSTTSNGATFGQKKK